MLDSSAGYAAARHVRYLDRGRQAERPGLFGRAAVEATLGLVPMEGRDQRPGGPITFRALVGFPE